MNKLMTIIITMVLVVGILTAGAMLRFSEESPRVASEYSVEYAALVEYYEDRMESLGLLVREDHARIMEELKMAARPHLPITDEHLTGNVLEFVKDVDAILHQEINRR